MSDKEEINQILELVFTFKTVVYCISGVGLILFGLSPSSLWEMNFLFFATGLTCIILAIFDFIAYYRKMPLMGEMKKK